MASSYDFHTHILINCNYLLSTIDVKIKESMANHHQKQDCPFLHKKIFTPSFIKI